MEIIQRHEIAENGLFKIIAYLYFVDYEAEIWMPILFSVKSLSSLAEIERNSAHNESQREAYKNRNNSTVIWCKITNVNNY